MLTAVQTLSLEPSHLNSIKLHWLPISCYIYLLEQVHNSVCMIVVLLFVTVTESTRFNCRFYLRSSLRYSMVDTIPDIGKHYNTTLHANIGLYLHYMYIGIMCW